MATSSSSKPHGASWGVRRSGRLLCWYDETLMAENFRVVKIFLLSLGFLFFLFTLRWTAVISAVSCFNDAMRRERQEEKKRPDSSACPFDRGGSRLEEERERKTTHNLNRGLDDQCVMTVTLAAQFLCVCVCVCVVLCCRKIVTFTLSI